MERNRRFTTKGTGPGQTTTMRMARSYVCGKSGQQITKIPMNEHLTCTHELLDLDLKPQRLHRCPFPRDATSTALQQTEQIYRTLPLVLSRRDEWIPQGQRIEGASYILRRRLVIRNPRKRWEDQKMMCPRYRIPQGTRTKAGVEG